MLSAVRWTMSPMMEGRAMFAVLARFDQPFNQLPSLLQQGNGEK